MLKSVVSAVSEDLDAIVVDRIMGRDVTRGDLSAAFNRVADKANWKNPIEARIPIASDFEMETIRRAIVFFTASRATFVPLYVRKVEAGSVAVYHVEAAGYYAAVGA